MSMRPKPPNRPKGPGASSDSTPGTRDTTADHVPRFPGISPGHDAHLPQRPAVTEQAHTPDARSPAIQIIDLPAGTHISPTTVYPISDYYLPSSVVERLPAADSRTGFRSIIAARKYVDLIDGGTVMLGSDLQGHFRARQPSELVPSGPRLERVEGTLQWRQVHERDSELLVTRRPREYDGQQQAGPSKRPRLPENTVEPWKDWGISAQHASPDGITIDGVHYKTVPRADAPSHPIAYIKNPAHPIYDFDLLQGILRRNVEQQPRGAIQVPPSHRWEVDPTLPFDRTLTDYVAAYFPELSDLSLLNVARKQFFLANGSHIATGAGLTTLRQVFNDWKTASITPKPDLADPLLMLSILQPGPGKGTSRILEVPEPGDQVSLQRLEFDPKKFREEWRYFISTQYAGDIKRFMEDLLKRNGYRVFEPTPAQSYPALVFTRTGHDFVFHMTLHRVHGHRVHIHASNERGYAPERLPELIGLPAMRAMQNAEAANKLIWLKGGGQISADRPDSVFIVRSEDPRL